MVILLNKLDPYIVLAASLSACCAGYAWKILQWGSYVNSWLFLEARTSEHFAASVDYVFSAMLLACAGLVWLRRFRASALLLSVWVLLDSISAMALNIWQPWLIPIGSAARWLAPLALVLLPSRKLDAEKVLRLGIALTFAAHGVEAWLHKRLFIDYVLSAWNDLGISVDDATAQTQLLAIAVIDVAVAVAILVPRQMRKTAIWMIFWGLATASMRVIYSGIGNTPEFLVRLVHVAIPLTLLLMWKRQTHEQD